MDLGGRSAQRLGLPRSLGQVFSALYLSVRPLGLQDLMDQLEISKGNASMSVRQLAEWGAVKRVWVKGDRKDYYEVEENLAMLATTFLGNLLKPRIESSGRQFDEMELILEGVPSQDEEAAHFRKRISKLRKIHRRFGKLLPLIEGVLK